MIKISKEVIKEITLDQEKNFNDVISPEWSIEDRVKRHFSNLNHVKIHYKELSKAIALDKKMKILDLGCGYGFMVGHLRKLGYNAFGCDNDKDCISIASKVLRGNGVRENIVKINTERLPYKDLEFDLIYISYVLVYVKDLKPFFREIYRILNKTGYVYLVTPNYQCCYDTTFGLFMIPWLPRWLNMFYLKVRGRNNNFFKSLSLTTRKGLVNIFKENNFKYDDLGIKLWKKIFDDETFWGRSKALIEFIYWVKLLKIKPVFLWLAEKGFYTPLIYVLRKVN